MPRLIFQQDGAPAHKSKLVEQYFEEKGIEILPWAAQSPDINVIENVWAEMKKKI